MNFLINSRCLLGLSDLSTDGNILAILLQILFQPIATRPSYDTLHFSITPLAPFFGCMYQTRYPVGRR